MSTRLRVGMGNSYGLSVTVLAGADFDPADPTGAVFNITKPTASGETTVQWTAAIDTQSAASLRTFYQFDVDGLDLDYPGTWRGWIQWTVVGQTPGPRSEVFTFAVVAADAP